MVGGEGSKIVGEGATGGTGPEFIHDGTIECEQGYIKVDFGYRPTSGGVTIISGICQFKDFVCGNVDCSHHPEFEGFDGFNKAYIKLKENSKYLGRMVRCDGSGKVEVYETGDSLITVVEFEGTGREFWTKTKADLGEHDYKQMRYELLEALVV